MTDIFSQVGDPLNRRAAASLYLPDVISGKLGGQGGQGSQVPGSLTAALCGKGRQGAILCSYKSLWRDLHSVFRCCFLLSLQLSERNINYSQLFQQINQKCLGITS